LIKVIESAYKKHAYLEKRWTRLIKTLPAQHWRRESFCMGESVKGKRVKNSNNSPTTSLDLKFSF